jgi:hypothetical protein
MYNVRFGDAVLVTIPDKDPATGAVARRNLLIDVGNVLNKEGGADEVFKPVVEDILRVLDGKPLDLYVMTHEHLDHVQGLFHAATRSFPEGELRRRLDVRAAWLTASAHPRYYDTHPDARRQKDLLAAAYQRIASHLAGGPQESVRQFASLLANNDPRSTSECVDFLRSIAPVNRTFYAHRQMDTAGKHPFKEARFEVWAPEEDTSAYYRSLLPMATAGPAAGGAAEPAPPRVPPAGVDAGAFYDLVDWRARGFADNLLAIDRAANNTSVVLCLEWRGKRLLFAGDAEIGSWRMMEKKGVLKPVDFLKVSHHGSHNGTPDGSILDRFLPKPASGAPKRRAAVSTWDDTYSGIPHTPTNDKLKERARFRSTLDRRTSLYYDVLI